MQSEHFVFVMEQTLGNAVHATNLKNAFRDETNVEIEWVDINYPIESRIENFPPFRTNWTLRSGLKARRAIGKLQTRPNLYFFHTATPTIFSIGKTKGVPSIISLDATPINYDTVGSAYNHQKGSGFSENLKLSLHRHAFKTAKRLVTWSRWAKKSLVEDYGIPAERIEVIPPGTDLRLWELTEQELASRRTKNEGEPVRILFVGGDFKRKGGELLLDSYRQLVKGGLVNVPAELHLVTKAEIASDPEIGLFVHRNITANSPEMQKLFRQADIFALPTEGDCLPVAIGESLAAKLPVISTRVGAIDEAVLEGENGFLMKPGDGAALATNLRTLIENPELRVKMGERSRELAEADHDALRNSQRLLELCKVAAKL